MHVGQHMREADAAECLAALGKNPIETVALSFDQSTACWTWEVDGVPACMFGYELPYLIGDLAHPWLLTTPLIEQHRFAFARGSRDVIAAILTKHPLLRGLVDARYKTCIRWLRWSGFMVGGLEMLNGHPFHYYELRA
jgi:hypothetical protein